MFETYYRIADIVIKIKSDFPFYVYNAENFKCASCKEDYVFTFIETDDIPKMMQNATIVANVHWAHEYKRIDGTYFRAFLWRDIYYGAISFIGEREGICYYGSKQILVEKATEGFEFLMYLCLEQILLKFDALVLHSSHIDVNNSGLVFSAPSQTGKSTQADLWKNYAKAKVINGDRSVLRKFNNRWWVYGCPMCGTSGIHEQSGEKLDNIIMLTQGHDNQLEQILGLKAFQLLYPQITVSVWDEKSVSKCVELLSDIIENVPVWYYSCTKTSDAVYVLKEALGL